MSSNRSCHHSKKHFESKVDELVRKYIKVSEPGPALRHILNNGDESALIFQAIRRQVALIRCRSQSPENDQITIYDRALLILTRYGEDPRDFGALEFYMTEFLGIVPIFPESQSKDILSQHAELQAIVNRETESAAIPEIRLSSRNQQPHRELSDRTVRGTEDVNPNDHRIGHYVPRRSNASHASDSQGVRDQAERIVGVFYEARRDYVEKLQTGGFASMTATRFLRDTAENALLYLSQNAMMDHAAVGDLQSNFALARDKVAELCGGRKRHFDDNEGRDTHKRLRSRRSRRITVDSYRPSEYRS
ncbi:uncharacterized protein KD926_002032 [Aspergillus affinis]|uniref:uncharacterized protein n=1 Tax=Aspergillus affinis TaxID=1070780 RepID=UPI0022FEA5CE|nr:uncharacterized protein KD926_002032 [Aspergillus affinis]KAI9036378.1 hypothetical protein KD926_002032 [Aspergillus affinis]